MALEFVRDRGFTRLARAGRATVGGGTYGAPAIHWWGEPDVRLDIGRYCSIAGGVRIFMGGNHRVDWVTTYPFTEVSGWPGADLHPGHPATRGSVRIGNDVWLASDVTVLSGVSVGDGAVLGTGAVVAKDVPPYAIAAGNPARVVRHRFDADTIEALCELAWWTLDEAAIRRLLPMLLSPNIDAFLAALRAERMRADAGDDRQSDSEKATPRRWWRR